MASRIRCFPYRTIVYCLIIILELLSTCFGVVPTNKFQIKGRVIVPSCRMSLSDQSSDCSRDIRVLVDGGTYLGFPRSDGSFVVNNVPPGSYIVEVSHHVDTFDRFRVDINPRGKIRARLLDLVQQSAARRVVYPLRFKAKKPADYFQKRDAQKWYLNQELLMYLPMLLLPLMLIGMMKYGAFPDQNELFPAMAQLVEPLNRKDAMSTIAWPDLSEIVMWLFGDARPTNHEEPRDGRNRHRKNASHDPDRTSETASATAEALNRTASAATGSQQPKGSRAKRSKRRNK